MPCSVSTSQPSQTFAFRSLSKITLPSFCVWSLDLWETVEPESTFPTWAGQFLKRTNTWECIFHMQTKLWRSNPWGPPFRTLTLRPLFFCSNHPGAGRQSEKGPIPRGLAHCKTCLLCLFSVSLAHILCFLTNPLFLHLALHVVPGLLLLATWKGKEAASSLMVIPLCARYVEWC